MKSYGLSLCVILCFAALICGCAKKPQSSEPPPSPGAALSLKYDGRNFEIEFKDALYNNSGSSTKGDLLETGDDDNGLGFTVTTVQKKEGEVNAKDLVGKRIEISNHTSEFGAPRIKMPDVGELKIVSGDFTPESGENYKYEKEKASGMLKGKINLSLEHKGTVKSCSGSLEIRYVSVY